MECTADGDQRRDLSLVSSRGCARTREEVRIQPADEVEVCTEYTPRSQHGLQNQQAAGEGEGLINNLHRATGANTVEGCVEGFLWRHASKGY